MPSTPPNTDPIEIHPDAIKEDQQIQHNARQNIAYMEFLESSPLGGPPPGHYRNAFAHHIQIIHTTSKLRGHTWHRVDRPDLSVPSLGKTWVVINKPTPSELTKYTYLPAEERDVGFEEVGNVYYKGRIIQARQTRKWPVERRRNGRVKRRGWVRDEPVWVKVGERWEMVPPGCVSTRAPAGQLGPVSATMTLANGSSGDGDSAAPILVANAPGGSGASGTPMMANDSSSGTPSGDLMMVN
jgi:hypothetical protein